MSHFKIMISLQYSKNVNLTKMGGKKFVTYSDVKGSNDYRVNKLLFTS